MAIKMSQGPNKLKVNKILMIIIFIKKLKKNKNLQSLINLTLKWEPYVD